MSSYRDLEVFGLALDLVILVYEFSAPFPRHELYGLSSQMRRASVGVVSQIAEGHGRLTFGERRQLCSQARGSLFEIEAQCLVAERLGYASSGQERSIMRQVKRTGRALDGLIAYIRTREKPRR